MQNMIKKIIQTNEPDLLKRKSEVSLTDLEEKISKSEKDMDFVAAFKNFGIIAEIKLASPSAGVLADKSEVLKIATDYKAGGANAISVITEKYFFKGDVEFIQQVREISGLPVLQKDFIVDPYQIYESKAGGADALLLIAKIVTPDKLKEFTDLCLKIGLEPLIEINDELDLKNALQTGTNIIAVNARDLETFNIDIEKACSLIGKIPGKYLKLGFSGVNSGKEVQMYKNAGANGILVGTNLMKAKSKIDFLKGLL